LYYIKNDIIFETKGLKS